MSDRLRALLSEEDIYPDISGIREPEPMTDMARGLLRQVHGVPEPKPKRKGGHSHTKPKSRRNPRKKRRYRRA